MKKKDSFNFFVPVNIEKAGDTNEMKISGICSSIAEDSDGEMLEPTGFDFKPLLKTGFFNWNHQANVNPGAIVGKPTSAKVINNGKDFHVEGILYKGSKEAEAIYNLAQTLAANDPDRQLGFSIEGQAVERDLVNPKRIKKARITGIAITHCPKNPNTLLNIIKGDYDEAIVKGEEVSEDELKDRKKPERDEFESDEAFEKACHEFEKAMIVNPDLNPPSIDGVKNTDEKIELKKSETYNQIFKYLEDEEDIINKSKQIFQLTEKISDMSKTPITQDTINKAFAILDLAKSEEGQPIEATVTEPVIEEGQSEVSTEIEGEAATPDTIEKSEDQKEVEGKIIYLAKSYLIKSKLTPEEVTDKLVKSGYDEILVKSCVEGLSFRDEKKIEKSEISNPIIQFDNTEITTKIEELINSNQILQKSLIDNQNEKFSAVGEILKSITTENTDLKKSLSNLQEEIETIGKTPFPQKSVTKVSVIDKFEKSEAADPNQIVLSLSNSEDRKTMADTIFGDIVNLKSRNLPYDSLEKAVSDIEISKSMSVQTQAYFQKLGIKVQN